MEEKDKEIADLKAQVDNLNKGLASTRDSEKGSKEEVAKTKAELDATKAKLAEAEKSVLEKKSPEIKLSTEEEKKFEALMKEKGLVTKSELDAERAKVFNESLKGMENQAVTEFLEKHKEYDDDKEWKKVEAEFALYRTPTTLQGFKSLLNRIHSDLSKDSEKTAEAKARAEIISKSRLGLGGGSQKTGDEGSAKDIADLHKRYPNLSPEQIENRLLEIQKMYPTKK